MLKFFIFYSFSCVCIYLLLSCLLNSNLGTDREFDEAMSDNSARLLALLISSIFWPIVLPILIINNLRKEDKNENWN